MTGGTTTPAPGGRRWLSQTADKVPTKWLVSGLTALFLAGTAAFGGLNTAAEVAPPTVPFEQEIVAEGLTVTVHDAWIADTASDWLLLPLEGERILFVDATITNTEDWTIGANGWADSVDGSVMGRAGAALEVSGRPELGGAEARVTGTTDFAEFPPGVAVPTTLAWVVDPSLFAENGPALRVWNRVPSAGTGSIASERETFLNQTTVAANIDLRPRDEGAGE